ncbi:Myosin-J heavy chain [Frankliniella fusca]|uniref:Myosin-J heavy chain n=1 Tax=Frankliniella fusca TaxID=407009 RepID=A0AAE1HTL2_9NEOP|nr:Myosin-J heavy chain [Frankliniella fusca]
MQKNPGKFSKNGGKFNAADHVHVVHRGVPPSALPRPLAPLASLVVPRRRVHVLDPRTALNLVTAHETRRRRGSKRPPPYHRRGPPRPGGPPRPARLRGPGPAKRKGPRGKPWTQATRGSSPAPSRVRYSKAPRKKAKSKKNSKSKARPQGPLLPAYADGYAEDEDLVELQREPEDADVEEDRPRRRPAKSSSSGSGKQQLSSYPKGWGADGGYRVPAPAPQYPPYGTDEDEPGTGHLDLEERFINQHNQFYQHGYPGDSGESAPAATQSKKRHRGAQHPPPPGLAPAGLYEDEEIELAEATDDFDDGGLAATTSHTTRQQSYRRPGKGTRYQLQQDDGSSEEDEYRRPYSGSKGRGKKKDSRRHQSMYHAKFREQQDDRTLARPRRRVVIEVPVHIRSHQHTHTVYRALPGAHAPAAPPAPAPAAYVYPLQQLAAPAPRPATLVSAQPAAQRVAHHAAPGGLTSITLVNLGRGGGGGGGAHPAPEDGGEQGDAEEAPQQYAQLRPQQHQLQHQVQHQLQPQQQQRNPQHHHVTGVNYHRTEHTAQVYR